MMTAKRKRYRSEEIVSLLQQHLIHGVPVPDICQKHGLHPTIFYRWQRELFRRAHTAFERRFSPARLRTYQEKLREMKTLLRCKERELCALQRRPVDPLLEYQPTGRLP